jgi:hypothetical protein
MGLSRVLQNIIGEQGNITYSAGFFQYDSLFEDNNVT